jgi:hypothetical protein
MCRSQKDGEDIKRTMNALKFTGARLMWWLLDFQIFWLFHFYFGDFLDNLKERLPTLTGYEYHVAIYMPVVLSLTTTVIITYIATAKIVIPIYKKLKE